MSPSRSRALVLALGVLVSLAPASPAAARSASETASVSTLPECAASPETPVVTRPASPAPDGSPVIAAPELTVFGAASLRNAFEALVPALQAETGIVPLYAFDASSALRTRIEQGAPADVFASADTANVMTLLEAGQAEGPVVFACNQLTIIVATGNPAGIGSAQDLGRAGVRVVAAGDEVPITKYAVQVVTDLGIADAYTANIVSREDNVAAIRTRIELGEGDAGIVYLTDAIASGDLVQQVPVPPGANVPASYAAAIVTGTDQPDESAAFLAWLTGPAGQAALARFGFLPAP